MKRLMMAFVAVFMVAAQISLAQDSGSAPPEQGLMIIPGGDRVAILGRLERDGLTAIKIYRKTDGAEEELVGELPAWSRNPNLLLEELGEEKFAELAEKYDAKTPAEFMHKAGTNPGIYISIMTVVPRYPRLLGLYENTYIFIDNDIESGSMYEYSVKVAAGGAEAVEPLIGIPLVNGGDRKGPPTPVELDVDEGDGQVTILWKHSQGDDVGSVSAGFFVYRKEEGDEFRRTGYSIPSVGDQVTFLDVNIENDIEYTYYVTAVNMVGIESNPSEEIVVKTVDLTPPPNPSIMAVSFEDNAVRISWETLQMDDISHYNVYRKNDIGEQFTEKLNDDNLTDSQYEDSTVTFDGATLFYAVTAVDENGNESMKGTARTVTVPDLIPPEPAVSVSGDYDSEKDVVLLRWSHSPSDDKTVYAIFKGEAENELILFQTINVQNLEFKDKFVDEGKTYFYAVNTQDRFANVSVPEKVVRVEIPDQTPPPPTYNLRAGSDVDSAKTTLEWNDVKSDDFKVYEVYRSLQKEGEKEEGYKKVGESKTAGFKDETAEKGILYWYRVSQVDTSDNESELCKPASAMVKDSAPPDTPSDVAAEFMKDGLTVTWEGVSADDLAGYNIYIVDLFRYTEEKVNEDPVKETKFLIDYKGVRNEGNIGIKVAAVDTSENESEKTKVVHPE